MQSGFWTRTKLKFLSNVVPLYKPIILPLKRIDLSPTPPQIALLDKLDVELTEAIVTCINLSPLFPPEVSSNLCIKGSASVAFVLGLREPEIKSFEVGLREPNEADLTSWLHMQLLPPLIEWINVRIDLPKRDGKTYTIIEDKTSQLSLFPQGEQCIHGLEKKWCVTCFQKDREEKAHQQTISIFDILLPILQPPLEKNFGDPIAVASRLYDFQVAGVKFLVEHDRALLGDEMGLGKSVQAIVAIRVLLRKGKICSGLILSPKSVLMDWEVKLWEWAPEIRVVRVSGNKEQRRIQWTTPANFHLATYETLRQDLGGSLGEDNGVQDVAGKEFDIIIFDEIQKLKNPESGISRAARLISSRIRWGLSGTPLENRIEELISVFSHIRPGFLRSRQAADPWMVREAIKHSFLRRRKKEALPDLPEKVYEHAWLELTDSQRLTYDRAEQQGIVELNEKGEQITVQHILALITKLKQICNVDPVSKESSKLEFIREKLEEIVEENDKVLIFSQYPHKTIPHLKSQLEDFFPLEYSGALSEAERNSVIHRFQHTDENKVLLMSVRAGGLGLTLTRANYVYHFDLWWNPAVASQAEDRAHRIGQHRTVFVTYLYTVNTIEEKIERLLRSKRKLFGEMIDDLSDTNMERILSKDDLLNLFNIKPKERVPATGAGISEIGGRSLSDISPNEFEDQVSRLYEVMGYHVKKTPATRDHGVDVYAKRQTDSGEENLAIQCKHYPNGVVGVEHARALYGVIQAEPSITKGILLTSGTFSRDCRQFAQGKRIELFDVSYIQGMLQKYNLA